jgi:hypothetical protein
MIHVGADFDPGALAERVASVRRPLRLQFEEPLPDRLLDAVARVIAAHPEVAVRVFGPDQQLAQLGWLSGLEHIRHLSIELWSVTSFDPLARLSRLETLWIGRTRSARPSLSFLRELSEVRDLGLERCGKDFDAIATLSNLRRLVLRAPPVATLGSLSGHERLRYFALELGGISDLSALADLPALEILHLRRIRHLDGEDLMPVGACRGLQRIELMELRHVTGLRALTQGPSETLRDLWLEGLTGMQSLAELTRCKRLEFLRLGNSRPADRDLAVLADAPALRHLSLYGSYTDAELDALMTRFAGDSVTYRNTFLSGNAQLRLDAIRTAAVPS